VFGGRGRALADILTRRGVPPTTARYLASRHASPRRAPLPRDLRPQDWAEAYAAARPGRRLTTPRAAGPGPGQPGR
jgi:23S rRNA (adenine-N6)-dimethyltransferase